MVNFIDLYNAYQQCRIRKPFSRQQALFEMRLPENLVKLTKELSQKTYKITPHHHFIITKPKPREIFSAHFRDRVVHHYLVSKLTPIWEKKFSGASFACRVGKGTLGAVKELQKKVHTISQGGTKSVYVLQMDISVFFPSIHRETLVNLMQKHTFDPFLKWLIGVCISHDARDKAKNYTKSDLHNVIQKEKSWFSKPKDFGIPIGNLASQFGANIYLNDFDHFVLRTLKPQGYIRYSDDITFIDTDKNKLNSFIASAKDFLFQTRKLTFNDKKTKFTQLAEGISFLGYQIKQIVHPVNTTQILLPKKKKWKFINSLQNVENINFCNSKLLHPFTMQRSYAHNQKALSGINSSLGYMNHATSFDFRKTALEKTLKNTGIKDFNIDKECIEYWKTLQSAKDYSSVKIRKRLKK